MKHIRTYVTLRKLHEVSKYGVFSGPYSVRMREDADQKKPVFGHFSRWEVSTSLVLMFGPAKQSVQDSCLLQSRHVIASQSWRLEFVC